MGKGGETLFSYRTRQTHDSYKGWKRNLVAHRWVCRLRLLIFCLIVGAKKQGDGCGDGVGRPITVSVQFSNGAQCTHSEVIYLTSCKRTLVLLFSCLCCVLYETLSKRSLVSNIPGLFVIHLN